MRTAQHTLLIAALCCAGMFAASVAYGEETVDEGTKKLLATFRREFVDITPGEAGFPKSFSMGRADGGTDAERPVHEVKFNYPFSVAKYEVPQNLWQAVMGNNPSQWRGVRNSVEMVSFDDSVRFCKRVSELLRAEKLIGPTEVVRLPSEAEWEYAARAGTRTMYSFGDDDAKLGDYGWFNGNAAGNDPPVGAKLPNAWKLYDVHGYLWEWCADPWHADYQLAPTDGSAWTAIGDADKRVLRGGSWQDAADQLTSTFRRSAAVTFKDPGVGLRCVLAKERPAK